MSGKFGDVDFSDFEELYEKVAMLDDLKIFQFFEECSKELAARLLSLVIPRTPIGDYSGLEEPYNKKVGGTLRRGWTGDKETTAYDYAQSLSVEKKGQSYQINIINPVDYAMYVEFGHRQTPGRYVPALGKQLKASWVEGQFMLTISEDELRQATPKILEKRLNEFLKDVFG